MSDFLNHGWELVSSTVRMSTPLVLAALGGLLCERSGVINIALEGMMLLSAFSAAAVALATNSPWLGMAGAIATGVSVALLYALFTLVFRANQIVSGMAINLLALGTTPFLCKALYGSTIGTQSLPLEGVFTSAPILIATGSVVFIHFWLKRSPGGLWVRVAGEKPEALEASGISVRKVRIRAVLMSGFFSGLSGASLSLFLSSSFTREMSAGRGFIAIAAVIFGRWAPIPTAAACLFFGLTEAIQIRLQGVVLWGAQPVPVQWVQILPYVTTMVVLASLNHRSLSARAPRALGMPLERV